LGVRPAQHRGVVRLVAAGAAGHGARTRPRCRPQRRPPAWRAAAARAARASLLPVAQAARAHGRAAGVAGAGHGGAQARRIKRRREAPRNSGPLEQQRAEGINDWIRRRCGRCRAGREQRRKCGLVVQAVGEPAGPDARPGQLTAGGCAGAGVRGWQHSRRPRAGQGGRGDGRRRRLAPAEVARRAAAGGQAERAGAAAVRLAAHGHGRCLVVRGSGVQQPRRRRQARPAQGARSGPVLQRRQVRQRRAACGSAAAGVRGQAGPAAEVAGRGTRPGRRAAAPMQARAQLPAQRAQAAHGRQSGRAGARTAQALPQAGRGRQARVWRRVLRVPRRAPCLAAAAAALPSKQHRLCQAWRQLFKA